MAEELVPIPRQSLEQVIGFSVDVIDTITTSYHGMIIHDVGTKYIFISDHLGCDDDKLKRILIASIKRIAWKQLTDCELHATKASPKIGITPSNRGA